MEQLVYTARSFNDQKKNPKGNSVHGQAELGRVLPEAFEQFQQALDELEIKIVGSDWCRLQSVHADGW